MQCMYDLPNFNIAKAVAAYNQKGGPIVCQAHVGAVDPVIGKGAETCKEDVQKRDFKIREKIGSNKLLANEQA